MQSGWELIESRNGYGLRYEPGIIGPTGALIKISKEVYTGAKEGKISLIELFKKYSLDKCEVVYQISETIITKPKLSTSTKFYGKGFIVEEVNNKYYLTYQLASHGGGARKFEIEREIYEEARKGYHTTSSIFKKYNLYHLNVPENDVE